jgi:four helix bundle protein
MQNFRTYQLSLKLNRAVASTAVPGHLRNQLLRATSSISLNLAEGYGRLSKADQKRFYRIALGSLREVQACLELASDGARGTAAELADHVAASLWKLVNSG